MSPFVIYLLKANGLLIFFWLFYRLFLRKETFYTAIRWYFISTILLSLSIPLFTYTKIVIIEQQPIMYEIAAGNYYIPEHVYEPAFWETIDWQNAALYLAAGISLFFLTKALVRVVRLYNTIKRLPDLEDTNIKLSSGSHTIYSFYRWIVVPENAVHRADTPMILDHENVHLDQKHTLDLIFIELVSAVFWFNPLIKLLQKDINTNLEFIVDEEMIQKHERILYQKSLLYVQNLQTPAFASSFNSSDLKKRILQINSQKSKEMKKLKFLLTAPALIAFFALFQIETVAQIQTIEVEEITDRETSFIVKENFTKEDFEKLTKKLKEEFDIDFVVNEVKYKNNNIVTLNYLIRNKDLKISTSSIVSPLDEHIDPFAIIVNLNDSEPFRIEEYPSKTKYSVRVDNEKDPDFEITRQEWKDKSWIEKVSKNQKTIFMIDGKQSSETEVRRLTHNEIYSINVHKDESTIKKYDRNADNVVIIKTKQQIKEVDQLTLNVDMLKKDRKAFDEIVAMYPIVIDNVPMTQEQLKSFDHTKIQAISMDSEGKEQYQSPTIHLYTDPALSVSNQNQSVTLPKAKVLESIEVNGKKTTMEELMKMDFSNKKEDEITTFAFKFAPEPDEKIDISASQVNQTHYIDLTEKSTDKNKPHTTLILKGLGSVNESDEPLYIIDGKEATSSKFRSIHPDDIERVDVLEDKKAIDAYGDKGKNGIILIKTKASQINFMDIIESSTDKNKAQTTAAVLRTIGSINGNNDPLYIMDGKEISISKLTSLNPDDIERVDVIKNAKQAEKYGEKGKKNGVILFTTKANKDEEQKKNLFETLKDAVQRKKELEKVKQERLQITEKRKEELMLQKKEMEKQRQLLAESRNQTIEQIEQYKKEREKARQQRTNQVAQLRKERENQRLQFIEKRNETAEKAAQRRKELEKIRQEREKWISDFASAFHSI